MADLRTDYKDDLLDTSVNTQRKYRQVDNGDGTVSFVDETVYAQNGDTFGASEVNQIHAAVNLVNESLNVRYNSDTDMVQIFFGGVWVDWKAGNLMTYEDLTKLAGISITASSTWSSAASGEYGAGFMLAEDDSSWWSASNVVNAYFTIGFPTTVKVNSILLKPTSRLGTSVECTVDVLTAKSGEDFVKINTYTLPASVSTTLNLDNIECDSLRVKFNARNFYDASASYNSLEYVQVKGRVLE